MLGALGVAIALVVAVDRLYGHSSLAFAPAILLLLVANAPMVHFNCPNCGKNAFVRGLFVLPWPNRRCSRCGHDLNAPDALDR